MAETTSIAWTDATFNPWIGCSKVHAGCTHCYAEADMDKRRGRVKWGPNGTRSKTSDTYWKQPLSWNRAAEAAGVRKRVFCASLADVFEDWTGRILDSQGRVLYWDQDDKTVCATTSDEDGEYRNTMTMDDLRRNLFALIDSTPHLDWLLLTKRPENVRRMWPKRICTRCFGGPCDPVCPENLQHRRNVWLGTSISDQETADRMIQELLTCRDLCPMLFLSAEPLLGPIDLTAIQTDSHWPGKAEPSKLNCLRGFTYSRRERFVLNGIVEEKGVVPFVDTETDRVAWVVVGGESGSGARPCHIETIRSLVRQCQAASVPVFVKQVGSKPVVSVQHNPTEGELQRLHGILDSKGGTMEEWPEDIRVRQFPEVPNG